MLTHSPIHLPRFQGSIQKFNLLNQGKWHPPAPWVFENTHSTYKQWGGGHQILFSQCYKRAREGPFWTLPSSTAFLNRVYTRFHSFILFGFILQTLSLSYYFVVAPVSNDTAIPSDFYYNYLKHA